MSAAGILSKYDQVHETARDEAAFPPCATSPDACVTVQTVGPSQAVVVDGERYTVLATYPPWRQLRLFSLATAAEFLCSECREDTVSTMLATDADARAICPACFAHLARTQPAPR